uniref:Uncharacterized protein n=1 Tax=Arundo donax TaxID=35708 RepID=A0A0A8Z8P3_ARUDO
MQLQLHCGTVSRNAKDCKNKLNLIRNLHKVAHYNIKHSELQPGLHRPPLWGWPERIVRLLGPNN